MSWLEQLGLLLHIIALPQRKFVKLLDLHSKDTKEYFRGQVTLRRQQRTVSISVMRKEL